MDKLQQSGITDQYSQTEFDLDVIREFTQILISSNTLEKIFNALLLTLMGHKGIEVTALFLCNDQSNGSFNLEASKGVGNLELNERVTLDKELLKKLVQKKYINVNQITDEIPIELKSILSKLDCHLILAISIQHHIIGFLSCSPKISGKVYTPIDIQFLRLVANHAGIAISNLINIDRLKNKKSELEKKVFELESVGEISLALAESLNLSRVCRTLLLTLTGYLMAESGSFYTPDLNHNNRFTLVGDIGFDIDMSVNAIELDNNLISLCYQKRIIQPESDAPNSMDTLFKKLNAEICYPLLFSGQIIGLCFVGKKAVQVPYKIDRLRLAQLFVTQAISPIKNSQICLELADNNQELLVKREALEKANNTLQERSSELESTNLKLKAEIKERKRVEEEIRLLNENLEHRVSERTVQLEKANNEQKSTLDMLRNTQDELVQSQKMAALGGLVVGIAHEINTPLGLGFSEASFLKDNTDECSKNFQKGRLTESVFKNYLDNAVASSNSILKNLKRAGDLIRSFKQISGDQAIEGIRQFNVGSYLEHIVLSLKPKLREFNVKIQIKGDKNTIIENDPGIFSQIVTNLVVNSLMHAYEPGDNGVISISYGVDRGFIELDYSDNGKGIPPDHLAKIFDPFFTTKRGRGGTGLGLNIIYNLITQKLKGSIQVENLAKNGCCFSIKFPISATNPG